jgi:hypothetical protein
MMRVGRRLVVTVLVAAFVILLLTPPAGASCAVMPSLQEAVASAKFAFVGKVVATANHHRTARVRVDAVWKGTRIPRHVIVRGSPATGNAITTVDREYVKGRKYLFVPYRRPARAVFLDNLCSATSEYTAAVADAAPSTTR